MVTMIRISLKKCREWYVIKEYRATLCHWSEPVVRSNYHILLIESALSAKLTSAIRLFGVC